MQEIKNKITEIVIDYKRLFPGEYKDVVDLMKQKRNQTKDEFASIRGKHSLKSHGAVERALYEIPETLDGIFSLRLTEKEKEYYRSKQCARWFAGTFKEFASSPKQ